MKKIVPEVVEITCDRCKQKLDLKNERYAELTVYVNFTDGNFDMEKHLCIRCYREFLTSVGGR